MVNNAPFLKSECTSYIAHSTTGQFDLSLLPASLVAGIFIFKDADAPLHLAIAANRRDVLDHLLCTH
ncbi:MAG: hypothetical protein ACHQIM_05675, partial [Sphingobacteriales bacterium]